MLLLSYIEFRKVKRLNISHLNVFLMIRKAIEEVKWVQCIWNIMLSKIVIKGC